MAHPRPKRRVREVVLVGGGHTHVQVLRRFAMEPPHDAHLTLVVDTPIAVYSGMVPGFVAGQYRAEELEIDVVPLARRARARVILARAVGIDAGNRRIEVEGRPPVRYDVASLDIGSIVAGLDVPGVREHAFATRPIGVLVRRIDELIEQVRRQATVDRARIVVVGGGAGGVELAFALDHRLRDGDSGPQVSVTLLQDLARVLPGYPESLLRRVHRNAERRRIDILCNRRVVAVREGSITLEDGETLACQALAWVTGAVSQPIFRESELPTDDRGFVLVRSTLQVEGYDELFAAGDCATLIDHPHTPKAGVYAVRQGSYLSHNLRAFLERRPLRAYRPQRDFLTLLNLGDGTALGAKWGRTVEGPWVMRLKDWIDRRFMRRFQVLDSGGGLAEEFRTQPDMSDGEMLCGGCAAKLGQSVLKRTLLRLGPGPEDASLILGLSPPDDAAAYRVAEGRLVVASVDAFRALTDDPHLVGRLAAVNAVSDLYAKGVSPRYAMALVALPEAASEEENEETLFQVLSGVRAALDPLGAVLVGGHTTTAPELLVGLSVEGMVDSEEDLLRIDGLRSGQVLILSKPLGTGVLFHADMRGRARGPWIAAAITSMLHPNASVAEIALASGATAATDVTGFGLAGHLGEMARASGVAAIVDVAALPALPGAVELLGLGLRSTFHPENERARRGMVIRPEAARHPKLALLFDPQTSGGLLFGLEPEKAEEALTRLHRGGVAVAAIIGRIGPPRADGAPLEVAASLESASSLG